ncbi:MAG: carboxypeptidase-like regulatory domain-containing protein, partial [Thermofilaceae archaeon]
EAKVEQVCRHGGFELSQVFTFSGLSAFVRVDARLKGVEEGLLFFPFLRLAASDFREAIINATSVSVSRERSYVPAPRWLALRGGRGWLVVTVNYTSVDPRSVLEAQRLTLFRRYVNETHPLQKALYERLLKIHGNLTRVLTAGQLAEAGRLNLTQTLREADYLAAFSSERDLLLKNLTDLLEASEKAASRLLFMPQEGALNIAYQVGRREASISATIVLAVVAESPRDFVRFSLLSAVATPAVLYAPIEARLDAPTTVYVDDYLPVSAVVRSAEGLRNVSVRLVLPERAFAVVEGRRSVNFTLLRGTQRVDWTLRAMYEGSWPILLNVSSPWGSLILERTINVSLLPIVPRVIIPRAFNATIICIDAQGRPLSGYLVNLYENATRVLVRWGFTNESGLLRFTNVTAGVYRIEVTDGFHSTWSTVYIYSDRNFTVSVGLSNLRVRVELAEGRPLPQAAVYVRDEEGSLVCAGFTDANGTVLCTGLPRGNYTVSLRWQGALAGSTRVSLTNDTQVVLRGLVRLVTVYVSLGGSPAAGAVVAAFSPGGTLIATTHTDERGIAQLYLLPGPYRFTATKGQYSSSVTADVRVGGYVELSLTLSPSLWVLMAATAALWSVTAYVWHRRTSYVYRERERYKRLLQRLEELYGRGEVEERFYVKLKQEYETKLNELSRGEWE